MAQESPPQQRQREWMRSWWARALDTFFASLNFILSGPPPRQDIPERSVPQRKRDQRANRLWGVVSGIILAGIMLGNLLAYSFYVGAENSEFQFWVGVIAYILLIIVFFFLVGLLRGRMTGRGEDGATTAIIACLIQGLILLCLLGVFSFIFQWDQWGIIIALIWIVMLFLYQLPFSFLDGYVGGSIGSRFLYQRAKPDGVKRE